MDEDFAFDAEQEESEYWRQYKEERAEKKKQNTENSLRILKDKGYTVKTLNEHTRHYRVGEFDYWPSTGKFYNQKTGEKGRGVFKLIKKLKYYARLQRD